MRRVEHVFTTRDDCPRHRGCFPRNYALGGGTEEYSERTNWSNNEGFLSRTDTRRKERLAKRVKQGAGGTSVSISLSR